MVKGYAGKVAANLPQSGKIAALGGIGKSPERHAGKKGPTQQQPEYACLRIAPVSPTGWTTADSTILMMMEAEGVDYLDPAAARAYLHALDACNGTNYEEMFMDAPGTDYMGFLTTKVGDWPALVGGAAPDVDGDGTLWYEPGAYAAATATQAQPTQPYATEAQRGPVSICPGDALLIGGVFVAAGARIAKGIAGKLKKK